MFILMTFINQPAASVNSVPVARYQLPKGYLPTSKLPSMVNISILYEQGTQYTLQFNPLPLE